MKRGIMLVWLMTMLLAVMVAVWRELVSPHPEDAVAETMAVPAPASQVIVLPPTA